MEIEREILYNNYNTNNNKARISEQLNPTFFLFSFF